jgi:hypothetical protein
MLPHSDVQPRSVQVISSHWIVGFILSIAAFFFFRLIQWEAFHHFHPIFVFQAASIRIGSDWIFFLNCAPFSSRGFELHRYLRELRLPLGIVFNYTFVGLCEKNTTDPPNIDMPDNYLNWKSYPRKERLWTIRATAADFWIFEYVITETTARWVFISDDDILINFDLLPDFMSELDRKHDPIRDVVVRGDCIVNGPVYPQGGGGFVISRRAVERLVPFGNYAIWGFWQACQDVRIGQVMNQVFSGTSWYTSTAFLGCQLNELDFESAQNRHFTGLPTCPNAMQFSQKHCRRFVAPVRQLVFFHIGPAFHNGPGWLEKRVAIAHNLWSAPPQVSFWPDGDSSKKLCWQEAQDFTRFW